MKIRFNTLTWEEQINVLKELENICKEYGLKCDIDTPEHKSYIYGIKDGWHCEYPKLEEIMDKYNLYKQVRLLD